MCLSRYSPRPHHNRYKTPDILATICENKGVKNLIQASVRAGVQRPRIVAAIAGKIITRHSWQPWTSAYMLNAYFAATKRFMMSYLLISAQHSAAIRRYGYVGYVNLPVSRTHRSVKGVAALLAPPNTITFVPTATDAWPPRAGGT